MTGEGRRYEVGRRLRPSGNAGPMAVGFDGFAGYQRNEAWTWEHMALTRARVICGPPALAKKVDKLRTEILTRGRDDKKLLADELGRASCRESVCPTV